MTIDTMFPCKKSNSLKFKQIKAVYQTLHVSEEVAEYFKPGDRYTSPSQIYHTFKFLMQETKEMFITAHLNGKNSIIAIDLVSVGSLNQSIVHPRSVFQTALLTNAAAILLVHNHPTGDPTPSSEDISITRRLKEAGDICGINVLDHIIIGQDEYCSFVERGIL